jgi:hypothetical protein
MGKIPRFCIHNVRKYKVVADGIYWCEACGEHYAEGHNPVIEEPTPKGKPVVVKETTSVVIDEELIVQTSFGQPLKPVDKIMEVPAGCPKICISCLYRGGKTGNYCEMYSHNLWHCRRHDCIYEVKK